MILRKLAAESDVLVENYLPGTLAKYGLSYEQLAAVNPRLIYASITGFVVPPPLLFEFWLTDGHVDTGRLDPTAIVQGTT